MFRNHVGESVATFQSANVAVQIPTCLRWVAKRTCDNGWKDAWTTTASASWHCTCCVPKEAAAKFSLSNFIRNLDPFKNNLFNALVMIPWLQRQGSGSQIYPDLMCKFQDFQRFHIETDHATHSYGYHPTNYNCVDENKLPMLGKSISHGSSWNISFHHVLHYQQ